MVLILAALFDAALAWAILRMVGQSRLYAAVAAPDGAAPGAGDGPGSSAGWPAVAVVVPARNEAHGVAACVAGLLAQDYPADRLEVILVDDGSTDGTAEIARAAARGDPRLRIVAGGPLPPGWTGKSNACARGAEAAGETAGVAGSGGWLCFVDADTRAAPPLLRAAVAEAGRRGAGLLSLEPFQELGTAAERLVMPCGLYLVAATGDHGAVNDPRSGAAAANGQFLLFAPGAYAAVGGHAAVCADVCEDLALARLAKRRGVGFALLGAETLIRTRMYRDATALWHGLSKNVNALGGGARRTLLIAVGGLLMASASFALPALALTRLAAGAVGLPDVAAGALAVGGLLAALGLHIAGARHFSIPMAYGFAYPVGYALAFALAVNAARLRRRGRVRWKDRSVDISSGNAP